MLADMEAWFLGRSSAAASMDMDRYRRVVRHMVLALPMLATDNGLAMNRPRRLAHNDCLQKGNAILSRIHALEGKDLSRETANVIEPQYA
jgi:hypothetical protein